MRRFKTVVFFAPVVLLFGCGLAQQAKLQQDVDASQQQLASGYAECDRLFPDQHRKPTTPRMRCRNTAFKQHALTTQQLSGIAIIDLADVASAEAMVAAEDFDKGQLSEAQFDVALAKIRTSFMEKALQRENAARGVAAAENQAYAAQHAETMRGIQSAIDKAYPNAPPQTNTRCTTFGDTMNCTTQ